MKTTKRLIKDAFRDLLRLYIEVERQDGDQEKLKTFYDYAFKLLDGLLDIHYIGPLEVQRYTLGRFEKYLTYHNVVFAGMKSFKKKGAPTLEGDSCVMRVEESDFRSIGELVESLKASTLNSKNNGTEFVPFFVKNVTTATIHRPEEDKKKKLISKIIDIEIDGEIDDEFYKMFILRWTDKDKANFRMHPPFSKCDLYSFFDLSRYIIVHYFYRYGDTSKIQVCTNCGQIHARIYREGKNTFCSDKYKKHFDYKKHPDAIKCLVDVRRYYEKVLKKNAISEDWTQKLGLSRTYCKKCKLQKKISHPKECPKLLDNEFAQNLRLMDKS